MEKRLDIEIGGEGFQILLERGHLRRLEKHLRDYRTSENSDGCTIRVIPYVPPRSFVWEQSALDGFRRLFSHVHTRIPPNNPEDGTLDLSINIVRQLDPDNEWVGYVRDHIDEVIWARIGFNLYFLDRGADNGFFFIGEGGDPAGIFAVRRYWPGFRPSDITREILNGLMFHLSCRLMRRRGLLLHGAAVQRDGKGMLFLGLSGAGKSTIAKLCNPDVCFSDDGAIIRMDEGLVYAYRSPFTQIRRADDMNDRVRGEIHRIFLLEKGDQDRVIPMKRNEMMQGILMHFIHFFRFMDDETARRGFHAVRDLVEMLPAYRLQFTRNTRIWDEISGAGG